MDATLTYCVEDGIEPVVVAARVDAGTIVGSSAECVANGAVQLLVGPSPDARDDVHRLERVEDPVVLIDDGNAADVVVDHEVNNVEHSVVHLCSYEVGVGPELQLADRLLEEDGVMLVVDGNELEDAVLRDDRDHCFLARLFIDVDQRDTSRTSLKHAATGLVERARGVDGDGLDGDGADGLFNV